MRHRLDARELRPPSRRLEPRGVENHPLYVSLPPAARDPARPGVRDTREAHLPHDDVRDLLHEDRTVAPDVEHGLPTRRPVDPREEPSPSVIAVHIPLPLAGLTSDHLQSTRV